MTDEIEQLKKELEEQKRNALEYAKLSEGNREHWENEIAQLKEELSEARERIKFIENEMRGDDLYNKWKRTERELAEARRNKT